MYALTGNEKCIQCDILKNQLDEKGIQYQYLDMMEMPTSDYDILENVL